MENAKVYKVINDLNDKIYIGSSTNALLSSRMNLHRMACKNISGRRNSKLYNYMRELGIEHFKIETIERVKCETKQQLREKSSIGWMN